jgi:hypothetical protein
VLFEHCFLLHVPLRLCWATQSLQTSFFTLFTSTACSKPYFSAIMFQILSTGPPESRYYLLHRPVSSVNRTQSITFRLHLVSSCYIRAQVPSTCL